MEKILTEDYNIFFDSGFVFLSEHCNEQSASFRLLLLFSLVMTTASSYMIAVLQKEVTEHKG